MNILLIEDDNDDIELFQGALSDEKVTYRIHVIKDGGQVSKYLQTATDVPDIIVMDFNLPKVHGRDILKEIKSTHIFKDLPLVILTTSSSQEDINYSYKQGANKYFIKPVTAEGLREVIGEIKKLVR